MRTVQIRKALLVAAALVATIAPAARADDPKVELGASLASAMIGFGDNDVSTLGIPSSSFGILNPGVYVSFFAAPRLAIEPQIGLLWVSSHGNSDHILSLVGQFDYFFSGNDVPSLYAFGAAGVIDTSGSGTTPKSVGGGIGYRSPIGGRLTFRVDGRVTHFTEGGGDAVAFGVSIGGLFGER